ncbi:MAG: hypothetical protein GY719_25210 [bacterium]|nr:hypothetical protein [bacterium]
MIIEDLWTASGPSTWDLNALERLGKRRRAIEAAEPADEHQAQIRTHLLATLDLMEEGLCEEGRHAAIVEEGLQVLDAFEAGLTDAERGRKRKRRRRQRVAHRPSAARPRRSTHSTQRTKETRS